MGTKWFTGGVSVAPRGRIMFEFKIDGVRYRPTIKRPPSEANLRRARERLESIRQQIALGTFSFAEEFPDYRYIGRVVGSARDNPDPVTKCSMNSSHTLRIATREE